MFKHGRSLCMRIEIVSGDDRCLDVHRIPCFCYIQALSPLGAQPKILLGMYHYSNLPRMPNIAPPFDLSWRD